MNAFAAVVVFAVLVGLLPAFIAWKRGWPFVPWWIYGTVLFVIALPHAIFFLEPNHDAHPVPKK